MKRKFLILTLCFTIIFTSLNLNKSYADGGVISLPMLGVVSSLAVGSNIILGSDDDIYDLGRMFYDYVNKHNSLTWDSVKTAFNASVSLQPNKLVSVKSEFLDIVKGFFDSSFNYTTNGLVGSVAGLPYYSNLTNPSSFTGYYFNMTDYVKSGSSLNLGNFNLVYSHATTSSYVFKVTCSDPKVVLSSSTLEISRNFNLNYMYFFITNFNSSNYPYGLFVTTYYPGTSLYTRGLVYLNPSSVCSIPYAGGYTWDDVDSKNENNEVALPIPDNLGNLVGQGSNDFWSNTDGLVGSGDLSIPSISNPSISIDKTESIPNTGTGEGDIPNAGEGDTNTGLEIFPPWGGGIDFTPVTKSSFTEKFPFSLASDIKNILSVFDVEPVAPKFTVPILSEEINIDLTEFTDWANITRFFILIGFIISLINITRKVIG